MWHRLPDKGSQRALAIWSLWSRREILMVWMASVLTIWMASPTQWIWVWGDSRSWWWTGRPGMLRFMGSQKVGQAWVTELRQFELMKMKANQTWVVKDRVHGSGQGFLLWAAWWVVVAFLLCGHWMNTVWVQVFQWSIISILLHIMILFFKYRGKVA